MLRQEARLRQETNPPITYMTIVDRVKELKKLNHSAIFNFLDLVHVLSTSPGEVNHNGKYRTMCMRKRTVLRKQ